MASPRFFADPLASVAYYHCISRVVDRRFVFLDEEREHFVRMMRAYEGFCQVQYKKTGYLKRTPLPPTGTATPPKLPKAGGT